MKTLKTFRITFVAVIFLFIATASVAQQATMLYKGHADAVWVLDYSPNGEYLASGGSDGTVRLWNVATGEEEQCFKEHEKTVWALDFSAEGDYLVSGGKDFQIRVWAKDCPKSLHTFFGHQWDVNALAVSPNNRYILSGSSGNTLYLWDYQEKRFVKSYEGHNSSVNSLDFSADGTHFISASADKTIMLWDVNRTTPQLILSGHTEIVSSCMFFDNDTRIVSASWDKTIRIWDAATGEQLKIVENFTPNEITTIDVEPQRSVLAAVATDFFLENSVIYIIDLNSGQILHDIPVNTAVNYVRFSPDGKYLATACDDSTVKIYDLWAAAVEVE